jgi:peptide/nickel transport system substrate-binding protein
MLTVARLFVALLLASTMLPAGAAAQHLRFGLAEDPDILDPSQGRTFVGRIVFAALCDKLVDIAPDLHVVPQLATEWQWVDGNKGLVMKLRPGVRFHDGETFDAAAVKFNIERHLKLPESVRKSEISAVSGVEIVDPLTVKLVLSAPFAPLLAQLTDRAGMMVSPKAAQAMGAGLGAHPVCAGPFKFVERVAQDRIVVERFADYWDKDRIKLDRITFLPIPDSTVRLANLQSGALDLIERVAAPDLETLRRDKRFALQAITELGYQGITINTGNGERAKTPLGRDARLRQALSLAIDRKALNEVVFNGEFLPGNQWVSPENAYYQKDLPVPARDLDKARRLVAEAQMTNPSAKPGVEMMVPNSPENLQAAQVIQAMAQEAGLEIRIRATEFASSIALADKGDYEAYYIGWSGRTDPDGNIYNFVSCKSALNVGHYCNSQVDRALDTARLVSAPGERLAQYHDVATRTLADLPIIYLMHRKWLWAQTTRLKGFSPYPDGLVRPAGLRFE